MTKRLIVISCGALLFASTVLGGAVTNSVKWNIPFGDAWRSAVESVLSQYETAINTSTTIGVGVTNVTATLTRQVVSSVTNVTATALRQANLSMTNIVVSTAYPVINDVTGTVLFVTSVTIQTAPVASLTNTALTVQSAAVAALTNVVLTITP